MGPEQLRDRLETREKERALTGHVMRLWTTAIFVAAIVITVVGRQSGQRDHYTTVAAILAVMAGPAPATTVAMIDNHQGGDMSTTEPGTRRAPAPSRRPRRWRRRLVTCCGTTTTGPWSGARTRRTTRTRCATRAHRPPGTTGGPAATCPARASSRSSSARSPASTPRSGRRRSSGPARQHPGLRLGDHAGHGHLLRVRPPGDRRRLRPLRADPVPGPRLGGVQERPAAAERRPRRRSCPRHADACSATAAWSP